MDVEQISDTMVLWACGLNGLFEYNPRAGQFKRVLPEERSSAPSVPALECLAISKTRRAGVFIGIRGRLLQWHPCFSRLSKRILPASDRPNDEICIGKGAIDPLLKRYLIPTAGPVSLLAVEPATLAARLIPVRTAGPLSGLRHLAVLPIHGMVALSFDGVLYRVQLDKAVARLSPLPCAFQGSILRIALDARGFLWLLTRQNLYRLDAATLSPIDSFSFDDFVPPMASPFSQLYLYHLETSSAGEAWVGSNQGLWLAQPGKKKLVLFHPKNVQGKWLKDKVIKSMAIDAEDHLWVGYNGDGLDIFDVRHLQPVEWAQGRTLSSRQVNDIAITPNGYALATTTEGLLAIDRKTLRWKMLGTEDGLESQFMDKTLWVAPDGRVFIHHGTFLNVFHESYVNLEPQQLQVNILSLSINGVEQEVAAFRNAVSYLSLPASSNTIGIAFAAMHWLYPFKTQYSYCLRTEGSTAQWRPLDEPFLQLTALKPGKYVLELGAQGAGDASSREKVLFIEIRPPFYARTWFIVLCIALLFSFAYALYTFRMSQFKKQLEVRDAVSRNLHDDIGSSLSNIQILVELTHRYLDDREKAVAFLERIREDLLRISEALSEIVWNVNPKYDDLQYLFARMKRYAAESFEGKGIRVELDFPEEGRHLKMGMEQRRDLFLIFKECIHNLIRHANATWAKVEVELHSHEVRMTISDNGVGFSPENVRAGNGLASMRQRVAKWKGKLKVTSIPGKGTSVALTMPVR